MSDARIWAAVDRLVERAPRPSDLLVHRLHLFAARRWRAEGRPVPEQFRIEEHAAAAAAASAPLILQRLCAASDGPVLLLKGPELAVRYPDPMLRPFADVDVLVSDPDTVQRRLLDDGFEFLADDSVEPHLHHRPPLISPSSPLAVEVHERPKWIGEAPPVAELLAVARPSPLGVDGVVALPPAHHALLVAVHSWTHVPLRRLLDLVDVAVLAADADAREIEQLAADYGVARLWRSVARAVEALFFDGCVPWTLRTWARNLPRARERTVFESHLERWLSPLAALPPRAGLRASLAEIRANLRRAEEQSWGGKLRRTAVTVRHTFARRTEHERAVGGRGARRTYLPEEIADEPADSSEVTPGR